MPTESSADSVALARGLGLADTIRWPLRRSSTLFELRYGKALVESTRRPGTVPVYGTNGQTGTHDTALFRRPGVVLGRKGAGHLGVEWVDRDFWVIDTAYSLTPIADVDLKFAYYLIRHSGLDHLKHGTSNPSLTRDAFGVQLFPIPPLAEQQGIAATLSALDDKIESNRRVRRILRELGSAQLQARISEDVSEMRLGDLTTSIARGVAPKYADDDLTAPIVLNQKCIRDGWVDTAVARRMVAKRVAPEKRAASGDVLVNSTGTGTLGRVGRWHSGDLFVDGHVAVVKANAEAVGPTVLAYAMLGRQGDIENMATGSTGQTELSPTRLGDLKLRLPSNAARAALEAELLDFEERINALSHEESVLTQLRDTLLPELLSGRIRAPEA